MDPKEFTRIEKKLVQFQSLPTLPEVYGKVRDAIANPNINASELGDIIRIDQGIATSVLRIANSAYYGFTKQIDSISKAISLLGFQAIHDFVLSVSMIGLFPAEDSDMSQFDLRGYWEHSIAVAIASRIIANTVHAPQPETAFIAGLIHDIGRLMLMRIETQRFYRTIEVAINDNIFLLDSEVQEFGFTHNEVGAMLAKKWNLPNILSDSITYHHMPVASSDEAKLTVSIVHIADALIRALCYGSSSDALLVPPLSHSICQEINFMPDHIQTVMTQIDDEFPSARDAIISNL